MANENGWTEDELRVLEDAVDFHGQLSDRIIDDLADSLRKNPQAVKSMARRIRNRLRKAMYGGIAPIAATATATASAPIDASTAAPDADKPVVPPAQAVVDKRRMAVRGNPPVKDASTEAGPNPGPVDTVVKTRGARPYTELVKALEELDALGVDVRKARNKAEAAAKALNEAEARMRSRQSEVLKAFPAAKALVENALNRNQ